ncbi:glycosyltransferase family 2 protein [Ureibacillus chungkukjangi]|uniref:Cellulose synthase/poly-beta-1,6-N-acetylglucosamine synthase-like glycosyltransferase n=1 Tax=Ureibacillus chungkukjangi TaxID=1202712 RepID=A0A318TVR5_9BACL|nr:glycosyltransferase family 2 protein [Ureibacillus chungkukjangi]PYF08842.1 cellulose synthase/poly-beta-1,6-N-acetylglucosamine synthase-like glycosyltransferase [Ureibacillus chungkukjangi]
MDSFVSSFLQHFNMVTFLVFLLLYSYQFIYMLVAFKSKRDKKYLPKDARLNKYAVIIAARNEELVIGELIKSIRKQNYPQEYVDIFVIADNCTDKTADVAKRVGAIVRERFNNHKIGKGYALDFMFKIINNEFSSKKYDGYFIFDADNLLDENYILNMNQTFNQGYQVVTSYRNSKNFDQNWITAGYALWFLHEAEYLNLPRMKLNASCAVSGTGFLVHSDIIKKNGGWIHHLLTEDIEFSIFQILNGVKIGYCSEAVFYDEQPVTFKHSWHQRLRWAKGFYQVLSNYGKDLMRCIFNRKHNSFSCFDMTMTIMPAMILTNFSILVNGLFYIAVLIGIFEKESIGDTTLLMLQSIGMYYSIMLFMALMTTITEWNRIHCAGWKKIVYSFTFPFFMMTYIPISIVALFKEVEWKQIPHTVVKSIDEVQ